MAGVIKIKLDGKTTYTSGGKSKRRRIPSYQLKNGLSKFKGSIYTKLGFKVDKITYPNYKWVNVETNEIISRYQTTKKKLLYNGLGKYENTKKEIMQYLGFLKIYDSDNLRLTWSREEVFRCR